MGFVPLYVSPGSRHKEIKKEMVRQIDMEMDSDVVENKHPGCIWGIFRALNYSIWQKNVRKMLPCRKKGTRRRKMRLIAYDSAESHISVNPSTRKTSSTNKRSTFRTRIKSLISKEPSKEEGYKQTASVSSTQSRSQQIYSEVNKSNKQQHCREHINSRKKHVLDAYEVQEDIDVVDVLEMYRVNKNLFSKVSKYTDGGIAKSFCNHETNKARAKLTRSCSYPSPKLSQPFKFTKLDYEQNDIWSHLKNYKLFTNRQVIDVTKKYSKKKSSNGSSFEKYVQLLPKSFIGEPTFSSTKSLKLTNEFSFKRVRSLSRIDLYGAFEIEQTCDGHSADLNSNRNSVNDSRLYEYLYRGDNSMDDSFSLVESINQHDKAKVMNACMETEGQMFLLKVVKKNEETDSVEDHDKKLPHSSSLLEFQSNPQEDMMGLTGFLTSRDFEWENNSFDKESPVDSEKCYSESLPRSSTTSNKTINNNLDDNFHYVSNILNKSGFMRNGLRTPWHSLDHPLNPSVFDEVESCWHGKDLSPTDELCCHHQLLFDLVNEVLVQIYNTSFTYYPRRLSSNCRVPPMPTKYNILEEVWGKVSKIMNPKLGPNLVVEAIVANDIWTDDHWMNLQLESECVALELEDTFFEEFLEDITCS